MNGILIGALIEAAGIVLFIFGVAKTGMPPATPWLAGALIGIIGGNALVFGTAFTRRKR